ncbi:MAG: MATE family efflux transporter [Clostridia bacterium]|nr:MATE family efflux transporter [Clostridia bacterium]
MIKTSSKITEGPIFKNLFLFTVPIMLTGLLQVLYNMADNIVVGKFSGDPLALAAVGSTTALTALFVNSLLNIATGSGVIIAQAYGARDSQRTSRSIHTSLTFALIAGVLLGAIAFAFTDPLLALLGTKEEVFSRAALYFRIICIGVPAITIYNFGAAILRSTGNSKTPLYILAASGLLNVLLNLFFVIVCGMTVDGVALATIISQYLSAAAVILILIRSEEDSTKFVPKKMRIDGAILKRMLAIGIPAALQSAMFSMSNMILTGATNTLTAEQVSAKTIAFNVDALLYTVMNSFSSGTMTFVGQNYGAKNYPRVKRSILCSIIQVNVVGILLGQLLTLFNSQIVNMYLDPMDPAAPIVAEYAMELSAFILSCYFLCGVMESLTAACRSLGNALLPMISSIIGTCLLRSLWAIFIFPIPEFNTLVGLFICYPVSWIFVIVCLVVILIFAMRKVKKELTSNCDTALQNNCEQTVEA